MTSEQWYHEGKYIQARGLDISYRKEGSGETLFCLHGFPTTSWDYAPLWKSLASRFQVIVHDLVGLGKSAKPKEVEITISLQADIVEALAIHEGVENAHLLAHDLGDTVAQELLARQQEGKSNIKWLSCIFMNGGIFPEVHRPRLIQRLLLSPVGDLVARYATENTFRRNMRSIFSEQHPPTEEFIRESWQLLAANNGTQMMPRLIRYMNERKVHRERWVAPLVESTIPLRLINGIQDPVSGIHAADHYKEIVSDPDVVLIDEAGHYPHVETPGAVIWAILEFHARMPHRRVYN